MSNMNEKELASQQSYPWQRSQYYAEYSVVLGRYQALAALEHARGRSLLDLACGDGTILNMLSERFDRLVGVDANSDHLAQAKMSTPKATFHHGLIEEIDFEERFGTVTMFNVLEHVIDPCKALLKAYEMVAPGGVLIVHVPNGNALNRKIAVSMGTLTHCHELSPFDIDIAGHRRSYDMASLKREVAEAGLTIIGQGGVFLKMLSSPQMDWFLKEGPWAEGGFGWGRVGGEQKDWRQEFCRSCYEIGKQYPEDCNIIYVCVAKEE